jgi:squalene-hopene/tetraprenyl-beta-curcumene cyclase
MQPFLLAVLTASLPALCQPTPPPRASAKLFKDEVDGLIHVLREGAANNGALGSGTCRDTAMVLTAAGYCHRFYHLGDGPWVRLAVQSMFGHRRSDGAFADGPSDDAVMTTRWVLGALEVLEPRAHAQEIALAKRFLTKNDAPVSAPFLEAAIGMQADAIRTGDPVGCAEQCGREVLARLPRDPSQAPAPAVAVPALVSLVMAQMVARGRPLQDPAAEPAAWSESQQRGLAILLESQKEGVFYFAGRFPDVGLTGMGLAALQTKPPALRDPAEQTAVDRGIAWLLAQQNKDGSFGKTNLNYATCAAVLAIAKARDPRFDAALKNAQRYVLFIQNAEERGYGPADRDYGSIGYGGDERGDLSNLHFALEALTETGLDKQHEAFAKALVFLQRTQNLQKYNDYTARTRDDTTGQWENVRSGDDGGAAYYPGNSPAGYVTLPDGFKVARSYGSMTYALLKAYILCGLPADDARVQAAVKWIAANWALDHNPGSDPALGEKVRYQGLYYYYMVMAQALATAGLEQLEVAGKPLDWRSELRTKLASLQRDNGAWVNEHNDRWWENQESLCTIYVLLALEHCSR